MENEKDKPSFLKNHVDTLAIIAVNIAIAAILVTMCISNNNRIDCVNSRIDAANVRSDDLYKEFIALLKEVRSERKS